MTGEPLLSTWDAALLAGVSLATMRRAADAGKLPCRRTAGGRLRVFERADVLRFASERAEAGRRPQGAAA